MKCSKCGLDIPNGLLYCPTCGKEVQLVPDYNPLENIMTEQSKRIEQQKNVEKQKKKIEVQNKKKKIKLVGIGSVVVLLLVLLIGSKLLSDAKNHNSFTYQLNKAEIAYSNGEYEKARKFIERAIEIDSNNLDANLLLAHLFVESKDESSAIALLKTMIDSNPDSKVAYAQLLNLYDKLNMTDEIKILMDQCEEDNILEVYSQYVAQKPVAGLSSGGYDYLPKVDFYAPDGYKVYYSLDGKDPVAESTSLYTAPIALEEGKTQIKAIAVNPKNIISDVVVYDYDISIPAPKTPQISPSSGQFESNTKIMINVPSGCKAYYAFDEDPTKDSTRYVGPIDMPEGEHIFKAILINEYGKESYVASETYVLEVSQDIK